MHWGRGRNLNVEWAALQEIDRGTKEMQGGFRVTVGGNVFNKDSRQLQTLPEGCLIKGGPHRGGKASDMKKKTLIIQGDPHQRGESLHYSGVQEASSQPRDCDQISAQRLKVEKRTKMKNADKREGRTSRGHRQKSKKRSVRLPKSLKRANAGITEGSGAGSNKREAAEKGS